MRTMRVLIAVAAVLSLTTFSQTKDFKFQAFEGSNGAQPGPTLVTDGAGNIYGSTVSGGQYNEGLIFQVVNGETVTLYTFTDQSDGGHPVQLTMYEGSLYGTTMYTGYQQPTIFRYNPKTNTFTTLVVLDIVNVPQVLLFDPQGNIYGVCIIGGNPSYGTIVKFDRNMNETVLYNFTGGSDGKNPTGPLLLISGILYGVTEGGGDAGYGVVFSFDLATGVESVLHTFAGTDGAEPLSGVIADSEGNLYGTTLAGCGKTLVRAHGGMPLLTGCRQLSPANDVKRYRRCKRRACHLRLQSCPPDVGPNQASCRDASYPVSSCRRNDPSLL